MNNKFFKNRSITIPKTFQTQSRNYSLAIHRRNIVWVLCIKAEVMCRHKSNLNGHHNHYQKRSTFIVATMPFISETRSQLNFHIFAIKWLTKYAHKSILLYTLRMRVSHDNLFSWDSPLFLRTYSAICLSCLPFLRVTVFGPLWS